MLIENTKKDIDPKKTDVHENTSPDVVAAITAITALSDYINNISAATYSNLGK